MIYNSKTSSIINGLYTQTRIVMSRYGGRVELKGEHPKSLLVYTANGNLFAGYDFTTDLQGNLSAIRCYGSNVINDIDGMQKSGRIFELTISHIDYSNWPNSVIVNL